METQNSNRKTQICNSKPKILKDLRLKDVDLRYKQ